MIYAHGTTGLEITIGLRSNDLSIDSAGRALLKSYNEPGSGFDSHYALF
jgi:hypothetical protein